jgi:hypothetical protein
MDRRGARERWKLESRRLLCCGMRIQRGGGKKVGMIITMTMVGSAAGRGRQGRAGQGRAGWGRAGGRAR